MQRKTGEYELCSIEGEEVKAFIPYRLPPGEPPLQLDGDLRRLLSRPLLYLSLFLKTHRQEYYRRLGAVRTDGDWEGWLAFFLEGVAVVGDEAMVTVRGLHGIVDESRGRLLARDDTTVLSIRLFELLPEHPILTVSRTVELLRCSRPAAAKALRVLEAAGILRALDDRRKNRAVGFEDYIEHLREGTEAPV